MYVCIYVYMCIYIYIYIFVDFDTGHLRLPAPPTRSQAAPRPRLWTR